MIRTLLRVQRHNYTAVLDVEELPSLAQIGLEVAAEMVRNPGAGHRLGDYAQEFGISERSLQRGFRMVLNVNPTEYLRHARLLRVHEELRTAGPGTVIDVVAKKWGFNHYGRFARW